MYLCGVLFALVSLFLMLSLFSVYQRNLPFSIKVGKETTLNFVPYRYNISGLLPCDVEVYWKIYYLLDRWEELNDEKEMKDILARNCTNDMFLDLLIHRQLERYARHVNDTNQTESSSFSKRFQPCDICFFNSYTLKKIMFERLPGYLQVCASSKWMCMIPAHKDPVDDEPTHLVDEDEEL